MSLALATLIYEWRRYLAAIIALAFSGVLVLVMIGLFTGIIHSALATTERARADIFIMPVKTPTMVDGDPTLPARVQPQIYMNPHVVEVRSIEEAFGGWTNTPGPGEKQVQKFVSVWAVDPIPDAVTLPRDYTEEQRLALMEPGAILVDASNLATLGVKLNGKGSINGHAVWVRGILHNYQDINQTSVVASRETERVLQRTVSTTDTGPLMVRIDNPANAAAVRDQINAAAHGAYHASTAAELNKLDEDAILKEQIIGRPAAVPDHHGRPDRGRHHLPDPARGDPFQHSRIRQPARARHLDGLAAPDRHGAVGVGRRRRCRRGARPDLAGVAGRRRGRPAAGHPARSGDLHLHPLDDHRGDLRRHGDGHPQAEPARGPAAMSVPSANALSAQGLVKRFKTGRTFVEVLKGVDFRARHGDVTMVMGPSGSGKSTLIAALSGLLKPDQGTVNAMGEDLWSRRPGKIDRFRLQHCGFIFQGFNLFPALTALQQVTTVLKYQGLSRAEARRIAVDALDEVGLKPRMNQRPSELSGGEKQRIAIARAIAKRPTLLFADEPTSALDGENGQVVIRLLRRAATEHNAAVICVTHDPRLESFADRIIHIEDGRILAPGGD